MAELIGQKSRRETVAPKAADVFGIDSETCAFFFQDTTGTFWKRLSRELQNFRNALPKTAVGEVWDAVKVAFTQAREQRKSSSQSGVTRVDTWQPKDVEQALYILSNGKPQPNDHPSHPHKRQHAEDLTAGPEDDKQPPKKLQSNQIRSTLQLSGSAFAISSDSLQTLQPKPSAEPPSVKPSTEPSSVPLAQLSSARSAEPSANPSSVKPEPPSAKARSATPPSAKPSTTLSSVKPSAEPPLVDLTGVDDKPHPTRPETDLNNEAVSLQFSSSTFTVRSASLKTLNPGSCLNSEILNGIIHLIAEVGNVQVIDSLTLKSRQPAAITGLASNPNTKILLPMHICGNHWVLGVYDRTGLLVYDSLPSGDTLRDVSDQVFTFFSKILYLDEDDYPAIEVTSPMLQSNTNDCGIFCIIAAFCAAMDIQVPRQTDTTFWRYMLFQLLRPQLQVSDSRAQFIKFPTLPVEVPVSELPQVLTQASLSLSTSLNNILNKITKSSISAAHALEIASRTKKAIESNPNDMEDIRPRFEEMHRVCLAETQHLHEAETQITLLKRSLKLHIKNLQGSLDNLAQNQLRDTAPLPAKVDLKRKWHDSLPEFPLDMAPDPEATIATPSKEQPSTYDEYQERLWDLTSRRDAMLQSTTKQICAFLRWRRKVEESFDDQYSKWAADFLSAYPSVEDSIGWSLDSLRPLGHETIQAPGFKISITSEARKDRERKNPECKSPERKTRGR